MRLRARVHVVLMLSWYLSLCAARDQQVTARRHTIPTSYKPIRHYYDASPCAAYDITEIRALCLQYWMSRYILDVYDTVLFMDGSKNNVSATLQKNIGQNMYSLLILSHQ